MAATKSRTGKDLQRTPEPKADRRTAPSLSSASTTHSEKSNDRKGNSESNPNPARVTVADALGVRLTAQASAEAFIALVNQGIECWYQAGRMLLAWRKVVPKCWGLITASNPWISEATLEMFERIGNREVHPKVLLLPPLLAHRASMLSYEEQEKLINKPALEVRNALKKHQPKQQIRHGSGHAPLAERLPSAGHFKITLSPGEAPTIQKSDASRWGVPVVLDDDNSCIVQLLKP